MTQTSTLQERVEQILRQTGNPLTSVVILSFYRKGDLEANIRSLYEHTKLPFEVVIWDNASDQETRNYVRSMEGGTKADGNGLIRAFYSDANLGCSGGRREAIRQAKGNWIYTADNDMTYTPNWLEAVINRVEQDPKIGAANSRIVFPNGKVQLNGGILVLEDNHFGSFIEVDAGKDQFSPDLIGEMDCDYLCGGATLVKREVVVQVEHDIEYLSGFEDYDYSFQITNLGYRVVNCPGSTLIHHHISFDENKQAKEQSYIKERWNARRTWISMVHFLERTGINNVKPTSFYNWIERDGTKPFLKWGQIGDITFEYEDLFPRRAFSELTNNELRAQFDGMVAKNKEIRSKITGNEAHYAPPNRHAYYLAKGMLGHFAREIDGAFSVYNLDNLARHLGWVINQRSNGKGRLSNEDISYLLTQFKANVAESDPRKANVVYDKLREGFSRLVM